MADIGMNPANSKEASLIALLTRQSAEGKLAWTESTPGDMEIRRLTGSKPHFLITTNQKFETQLGDSKIVIYTPLLDPKVNRLFASIAEIEMRLFVFSGENETPSLKMQGPQLAELVRVIAGSTKQSSLIDDLIKQVSAL